MNERISQYGSQWSVIEEMTTLSPQERQQIQEDEMKHHREMIKLAAFNLEHIDKAIESLSYLKGYDAQPIIGSLGALHATWSVTLIQEQRELDKIEKGSTK